MENNFIKIYSNFLKNKLCPQKKIKVVFDCSNGTTGKILKNLQTEKLKAFFINVKPDGNFPEHGPNPWVKGATDQLKKEVLRQKADLGVIFDADGDRALFIDNNGRLADPDAIANLLIWRLKPKKIIVNEITSLLIRANKKYKIIKSQNGSYFIKKALRKTRADFGCERSGHYYFKEFFNLDSGILSAIEVVNAISKLPYKFSDYLNLIPQYYHSGDINIKYQTLSAKYHILLKKIKRIYKKQARNISHIDGLRMDFNPPAGGWWFNLQTSNTEPLIRLNIEAEDQKILEKKKKELIKLLKN